VPVRRGLWLGPGVFLVAAVNASLSRCGPAAAGDDGDRLVVILAVVLAFRESVDGCGTADAFRGS
jgi:hypothetical protein